MRQYENFSNNNYLYNMYRQNMYNNYINNPYQSVYQQPQGQDMFANLISTGAGIFENAMKKRNDGMYKGMNVGLGDGTGTDAQRAQKMIGISNEPEVMGVLSKFM